MSQVIGGRYTTQGSFRASRVGSWFVLSDPDGQLRGGLRLNALDQSETQRLQAVITIGPGLLNVVDQVHDHNGHWLVTAAPATPTLAEALSARLSLPPAVALLIAVDTAETLAALHNASSAHGGLSADAIVLGTDGRVLLAESGYAHALQGTVPGPGHDTTAWVKVLRALAAPRPHDDAKRMLTDAADEAEAQGGSAGLAAALTKLSQQVTRIPGYGERSALAMLAAMAPGPHQPSAPPPRLEDGATVNLGAAGAGNPANAVTVAAATAAAATVPVTPNPPQRQQVLHPAQGQAGPARTAIIPPNFQPPHQQSPQHDDATLSPAALAARMDQRKDDVLRFGRGVAALPPPPSPHADTGWGGATATAPKPRKTWKKRVIGILTALITIVLLVYGGYRVLQWVIPVKLTTANVTLAESIEGKCDVEAKVVGTIGTNGWPGTISYRWLTSDGKDTGTLAETVNFGTDTVTVSLLWTFRGKSTVRAKATLQIISPDPLSASTEFTYSCR